MQRQLVISLILIPVVLAAGAGLAALLVSMKPEPAARAETSPPLVVRAVRLTRRTLPDEIVGYGSALADRQAWISPEITGTVQTLADDLRPGVDVNEGDVLVRLDQREVQQQFERAESLLAAEEALLAQLVLERESTRKLIAIATGEREIAEREYDRVRNLLEEGRSGQRELDASRLALDQSRRQLQTLENELAVWPQRHAQQQAVCAQRSAELELARLNVQRCEIKAPFDGRLDEVRVEIGERVAPGQQLLSLIDPALVEVPIELPVSRRADIDNQSACRLSLESRSELGWEGTELRIAPSANPTNRTFRVYVTVDNTGQPAPLLPGMFVRAVIAGRPLTDVLAVPRGAVQDDAVFVCREDRAFRQAVEVRRRLAAYTVVSGPEPGQVVITSNLDALYDGARVELRLADAPAHAAAVPDEPATPVAADGSASDAP